MSSQTTVGVGQTLQIGFAGWTKEGNQALLSRRTLCCRELGEQYFLKALATDYLPTLPAASVRNDFLVLVINGDCRRVGFDGELVADITWRHTVAIAVEAEAEILVNQSLGKIAIVGRDCGQGSQGLWLKAFLRSLIGFAMASLIGHFFEPLATCRFTSDKSVKLRRGQKLCRK